MKITYNINLTPYQWDFCNSKKRYRIVIASTKVGKTHACMSYIIKRALEDSTTGGIYWWVAPIYKQAKIAFRRICKMLGKHKCFKINKSELTIETPNKSQIHFKSSDDANGLYGEGVNFLVFDEFTRSSQEAWTALRSTLTQTEGDAILIGNYTGDSNWGVQMKNKAETDSKNYGYWKLTAWDAVEAGILSKDEVLQAAKDLPTLVFQGLYLAEGGYQPDMLVDISKLEDLWTNTQVMRNGKYYLTCDVALQGKDMMVIGIWNGLVLEDIISIHKTDGKELQELLERLKKEYNVPNSRIVYDSIGVGNYLTGYFKGGVPYNSAKPAMGSKKVYQNLRSQVLYNLSVAISENKLYIATSKYKEEIKREMSCLKVAKYDTSANITIIVKDEMKKIIGNSPNYLDMMALRMYIEIMPKLNTTT